MGETRDLHIKFYKIIFQLFVIKIIPKCIFFPI